MSTMIRITIIAMVGMSLTGCHRNQPSASPPPAPGENLTGQQRVVGAMPILRRNITANDLHQLKVFIEQVHIDTNKYPSSLADLPGLERDARNLATLIKEGDLILAGGKNDL